MSDHLLASAYTEWAEERQRIAALEDSDTPANCDEWASSDDLAAELLHAAAAVLGWSGQPIGTQIVFALTRADLDEIAGRPLSRDEQDRFAKAIEHSSIPEALATIAEAFTTAEPAQENVCFPCAAGRCHKCWGSATATPDGGAVCACTHPTPT